MSSNKVHHMFEEYNSKYVNELKQINTRFHSLYEKFLILDKEIINAENNDYSISKEELETLKKKRLLLRDDLFGILSKYKEETQKN